MKRLISLLLVLAMVFSMAACKNKPEEDETEETETEETEESSGETTEETTEETQDPTEETEPVEPVTFEGLPLSYILTDADEDKFYELLEESEDLAVSSDDLEAVEQISDELEEQYNFLEDQCSIAQVIYYCDMSDEEASQRYLDCVEIVTQAANDYKEMMRRVYQSDAPLKDTLFEDWTQEELDMLVKHTGEVMELEQRNSEILVEYQALPDRASNAMVPLYMEHVKNNNRMAQIYGYENYYEYAYKIGYSRDYDFDQLENMRSYVVQYLAPAIEDAYYDFYYNMMALDEDQQELLIALMEESYDTLDESYVTDYMDSLPKDVRDGMMDAIENNHSYFTDSEDAQAAAFTAVLSDECFCFFGPGYANSMTVIHELGHYYAGQFGDLDLLSLDLAETHSQGNEWLFMGYLSQCLDEDVYDALVSYKIYESMATILICVLVDEFEQQVYNHADPESLDADDLEDIMYEICENYGGEDYISSYAAEIQDYWRYVVVENPVYYISYAMSGIAAINIHTIYQEDPQAALDAYRGITENDGTLGFLETLEAAGLTGPFDKSVYEDLADMVG